MWKRYYIFLLLAVLVFSCEARREDKQVKARISNITESVYASVRIVPRELYTAQAARSGVIEAVFVQEGDTVEAGQVLLRLAVSAEAQRRMRDATIDLQEAGARLSGKHSVLLDLKLELDMAREKLALDSMNYQRQKSLWAQDIGKQVDLEQYQLIFETSRDQYQRLENQFAQKHRQLGYEYQKAQNRAQTERSELTDFTLRATAGGIVYATYKNTGDRISTQEIFAEIGSVDDFVAELDIDEADITKITIADTVLIQLEAYADTVFTGRVSRINPQKVQSTQTFLVESTFLTQPPRLYNGLSGEANIVVDRRKEALLIPAEYLLSGSKVLTEQGERMVQVGVKNLELVEILSGIDSTTILLKPAMQ